MPTAPRRMQTAPFVASFSEVSGDEVRADARLLPIVDLGELGLQFAAHGADSIRA
jgi:hypothetical protein